MRVAGVDVAGLSSFDIDMLGTPCLGCRFLFCSRTFVEVPIRQDVVHVWPETVSSLCLRMDAAFSCFICERTPIMISSY